MLLCVFTLALLGPMTQSPTSSSSMLLAPLARLMLIGAGLGETMLLAVLVARCAFGASSPRAWRLAATGFVDFAVVLRFSALRAFCSFLNAQTSLAVGVTRWEGAPSRVLIGPTTASRRPLLFLKYPSDAERPVCEYGCNNVMTLLMVARWESSPRFGHAARCSAIW